MLAIVLTVCTNRKKRRPAPGLAAGSLPKGNVSAVAEAWLERVAVAEERIPASRLYCGRSFVEAGLAAERCGAPLFVVSAGLGLIDAERAIPSYSLTVSPGTSDNILSRIEGRERTAVDWWRSISGRSSFADRLDALARRWQKGPILLALPATYLAMLEDELMSLQASDLDRLRLFTRGGGAAVCEGLRPYVMPYDGRFDGEGAPIRGTHADFSQRAARHFAETALADGEGESFERHRAAVERALAPLTAPLPIKRAQATDAQIKELIRAHWSTAQGRATRMLRVLRDDLQVACEQKRFQGLFHQVRAERRATA